MRVEVARTLVACLLEQLDEKEQRLDRLRPEAQILIEAARLLIVEIDVEELAGLDRLGDGMKEVEARHLLVATSGLTPTISGWARVGISARYAPVVGK